MPKAMEEALTREAVRKGLKGEEINHFVFGTMQNKGMMHKGSKKKTKKTKKSQ